MMSIRPARTSDAEHIAALLRSLGWFGHLANEAAAVSTARITGHLEVCLADSSHTVLVAEDGALLGYAAVHWLRYLLLMIRPDARAYT